MSMSSLSTPISGLQAAQAGLYVTGHNLANHHSPGFTRQLVGQSTFFSRNIGRDAGGIMQIGLGTQISGIRQVRDHFLDMRWRASAPELNFWDVRAGTGQRLDDIFGELHGEFRLQGVLLDLNRALHELNNEAPSIESRGNFIAFAGAFINRVAGAAAAMEQRQMELNNNVASSVRRINQLTTEIHDMNERIMLEEASGANANDFRDRRNNAIDELSTIITITAREDSRGRINIISNGHPLLVNGHRMQMGLQYSAPNSLFVHPVFTWEDGILPDDADVRAFFNWGAMTNMRDVPPDGSLLSMIVSRGLSAADHTTPNSTDAWDVFNMTHGVIPQVQAQLDTMLNAIVTMFNTAFTTAHPDHGMPRNQHGHIHGQIVPPATEPLDLNLFVETISGRGMVMGNISINPFLLGEGGASRLPLTFDGPDDNRLVGQIIEQWNSATITMPQLGTVGDDFIQFPGWYGFGVDGFYRNFITQMATITSTAMGFLQTSTEEMNSWDNRRLQISGVSLEEEMSNMIRFQHAYNASARMINMLDSMMDRIINQTGRVGM
ncbi:MAG: flagellar hook-associated protein FlgK [Defluviitaleaceae bacterium]|nr:flagellar hook-associated protein FlgK [Defluviitaleaceae bacterium]